ncbi:MAG: cytochrome c-type biogenesis protein [Lautropia sp.]
MIRPVRSAVVALALLVAALAPAAADAQGPAPAPHPAPEVLPANAAELLASERFRRLAGELRCLVCQNQTLADSNAPLAQDLRNEVLRLMASGADDRGIKSYLVDRYGEFVLYRPSVSARNALLWFGPFLLLAIGAVAWWRLGRRRVPAAASADDALRRVDELLKR